MKRADAYRDPDAAHRLIAEIREAAGEPVRIMEFCGGHTHAIMRYGLRQALAPRVRMLSGPGCPVCVTDDREIDHAVALAYLPEITVATFGDMMRVPGTGESLLDARAHGAQVEMVYSALDALELARTNPERQIVMLGIGFETTAPTVAASILQAQRAGLTNYSVLSLHKLTPPAMRAILDAGEVRVDAVLGPGHVSAITGVAAWRFLPETYGISCAVSGFEPLDMLRAVRELVRAAAEAPRVSNTYARGVAEQGNPVARGIMEQVFQVSSASWRGLGEIPLSGLVPRPEFATFDASRRFDVSAALAHPGRTAKERGCRCGEVLRAVIEPDACPLFGTACTPARPVGPCMVSGEGGLRGLLSLWGEFGSMSDFVMLAHGSGGTLGHELVERVFLTHFDDPLLGALEDATGIDLCDATGRPLGQPVFTTDSYVVQPLFFPGGDIGKLAICGTVNDLSARGARPLYLSVGFILEEGLPLADLERVVASMAATAKRAGVRIVTGDTKVVERGSADKLFINTAGIGVVPAGVSISARGARPGDAVLINGAVGDHGLAIMTQREGLRFESPLRSDCTPLNDLVAALLASGADIHVLRDPTRGGLATTLNELADSSGLSIEIDEVSVPVHEAVCAASELLGLDPLYVANEGKMIVIAPEAQAEALLATMRAHPDGAEAAIIGRVGEGPAGRVVLRTVLGTHRLLDMLAGEQLPRIC